MYKIKTLFFLLVIALFSWQCNNKATPKEGTAVLLPIKKHEKSPQIKVLREFKITPEDSIGFLLVETFYNNKGLIEKTQNYSFNGTGEKDILRTWEYNDKGLCVKAVTQDGSEVTTDVYAYDENGKKVSEAWSRPNGQGEKTEYIYKEGRLAERKYYDEKGKYDYSRVNEYELDEKGRVKAEKQWEKYTDGTPDLLQYHITKTFYDNDSLKEKKSLREDGSVSDRTEYLYDGNGSKIEEKNYDDSSATDVSRLWYNEYGENILDTLWNGDKVSYQYRNVYGYDNYGNYIYHMYTHQDGEAWGSRYEIEFY